MPFIGIVCKIAEQFGRTKLLYLVVDSHAISIVTYSDFGEFPSVSLGFSSRMITGTKEIQTVLATIVQSPESKLVGSLPIANTAVSVVANSDLRYESAISFIISFLILVAIAEGPLLA